MKFIVDTQLPPKLAIFLKEKGYDAVHTTDYPKGHLLTDKEIRAIAINENRIIVTKDSDFFDYYLLKGFPPKILLLKFGNIPNQGLMNFFSFNIATIVNLFAEAGLVECENQTISFRV